MCNSTFYNKVNNEKQISGIRKTTKNDEEKITGFWWDQEQVRLKVHQREG